MFHTFAHARARTHTHTHFRTDIIKSSATVDRHTPTTVAAVRMSLIPVSINTLWICTRIHTHTHIHAYTQAMSSEMSANTSAYNIQQCQERNTEKKNTKRHSHPSDVFGDERKRQRRCACGGWHTIENSQKSAPWCIYYVKPLWRVLLRMCAWRRQ